MANVKSWLDKNLQRFISRKFLAWGTATFLVANHALTSEDWVAVTLAYIGFFKLIYPEYNTPEYWCFGISPEGIGTFGMLINLVVSLAVGMIFPDPPEEVQEMVESIRYPRA